MIASAAPTSVIDTNQRADTENRIGSFLAPRTGGGFGSHPAHTGGDFSFGHAAGDSSGTKGLTPKESSQSSEGRSAGYVVILQ